MKIYQKKKKKRTILCFNCKHIYSSSNLNFISHAYTPIYAITQPSKIGFVTNESLINGKEFFLFWIGVNGSKKKRLISLIFFVHNR